MKAGCATATPITTRSLSTLSTAVSSYIVPYDAFKPDGSFQRTFYRSKSGCHAIVSRADSALILTYSTSCRHETRYNVEAAS